MNAPTETASAPALRVSDVSVRFGGVRAVSDVSFDVAPGEIVGVIGPNGAGKTTLFDAIGGFVTATGHIELGGLDVSAASAEARARAGLGRSFQDAKLFPSLTVREVLACAFERHLGKGSGGVVSSALSLPWVRRSEHHVAAKVEELIELMGLGAFRDKFVAELSTGSRRIVDLAVIMAHDPEVLLLDEPSSGIAQREAEALGPLLLRIRRRTGAAMLLIEHDMPMVRTVSDRLVALETGQVLCMGAPDVVLADPRLVAAYLGGDLAVVERSGTGAHRAAPGPALTGPGGAGAAVRRPRPLHAERRRQPTAPRRRAAPARQIDSTASSASARRSPRDRSPARGRTAPPPPAPPAGRAR